MTWLSYIRKDFISIQEICINTYNNRANDNKQKIKEIAFRAFAAVCIIGGGILAISAAYQLISFTTLKIIAKTVAAAGAIIIGHDYIIRSQPDFEINSALQKQLFFSPPCEAFGDNSNLSPPVDSNKLFNLNESDSQNTNNLYVPFNDGSNLNNMDPYQSGSSLSPFKSTLYTTFVSFKKE